MVISEKTDSAGQTVGLLASFAKDLMVAQRHFRSYPKGHPVVESAVEKVIDTYSRLMQQLDSVTVAIAKDHVLVEGIAVDKKNVFLKGFAQMFFRHGIGLVTLKPGLTPEELKSLLVLLEMKRETVASNGGIEAVWQETGIISVSIRAIRYDLFTTSVNEYADVTEGLWERVARGLLEDSFSGHGAVGMVLDPEILAEIFNGTFEKDDELDVEPVMKLLIQEEQQAPEGKVSPLYGRLAAFVNNLNPNLRDQFLQSAAGALRPDGSSPVEEIVGSMPRETILTMLNDVNRSQAHMPPLLVGLLEKLAYGASSPGSDHAVEDVMEKMAALFAEDTAEQYVPEEYQRKLHAMISSNELPSLENDIGSLMGTLDLDAVEQVVAEVILYLAVHGGDAEELERLAGTMEEMCSCRLQTGDYHLVLEIINRVDAERFPKQFRDTFSAGITRVEFLEEVLQGLTIWGKSRYPAIRDLICTIGHPFVGPLLDHLAVEESISIRRFIIDRLVELGSQAKDEVVKRLSDGPWYYLRNLLIVLRSMNDPSLAVHVRPLLNHPHETLRQEALRTLHQLGDASALRRIALDLESSDRSIVIAALHVAGQTRSADIFRKILGIATQGGLSPADVELRCAAVRALGEIGAVSALPELIKVLHSSSLLRAKALGRIKNEIVRSLATYPLSKAIPLLKALAVENGSYSPEAAETLKGLKENR